MAKIYKHLTTQERAVVMTMRDDLCSIRLIAKRLCRSTSTIGREIKRTADTGYDANRAHLQCQARRTAPRRVVKLHTGSVRHQPNLLRYQAALSSENGVIADWLVRLTTNQRN